MDLNWKLNKTEHIVQDEWIDFRKESFILPDGNEFSPFYNYSRRNFVVIIARTKDDKYITVKQFRHGLKKVTTEFCAGGIEGDEKDSALLAAKRELEEETGYRAKSIKKMREVYPAIGYSNEKTIIFLAKDLVKTHRHLDETEDIEVVKVPMEEAKLMLDNNEIITSSETVALLHYFMYEANTEE